MHMLGKKQNHQKKQLVASTKIVPSFQVFDVGGIVAHVWRPLL